MAKLISHGSVGAGVLQGHPGPRRIRVCAGLCGGADVPGPEAVRHRRRDQRNPEDRDREECLGKVKSKIVERQTSKVL